MPESPRKEIAQTKPTIVVSAINVFGAGPLAVVLDCLNELHENYTSDYEVYALVHNRALFENLPKIRFIQFPLSRLCYLLRVYYEYCYFRRLSRRLQPYLWFSLHDMTPNVVAHRRAVYCHNASGFYDSTLRDLYFSPRFYLFSKFYNHLYGINIRQNDFVVVQQDWLRREFIQRYQPRRVLVATPKGSVIAPQSHGKQSEVYTFFYPAFPRPFKNLEVIIDAVARLTSAIYREFAVLVTLDGSENRYARYITRKCGWGGPIRLIGIQPRNRVFELYAQSDCLLFPSKLESWGLPLSEFKAFGKPILVSDLPYAHETIGAYDKACFFNPDSPEELATRMASAINRDSSIFTTNSQLPPKPDAASWRELLDIVIGG
jgi:glycosyltransferase involved in cell wall biosynthesis